MFLGNKQTAEVDVVPCVLRRITAGEELLRAFPGCRAINAERSVLDLPLEVQGKNTALRISLPPSFPQVCADLF